MVFFSLLDVHARRLERRKSKKRALTAHGPMMFRRALPACGLLHQDRSCNTELRLLHGTACQVDIVLTACSTLYCANGFGRS